MENPIKMDDLGVPLFSETPIYEPWASQPRARLALNSNITTEAAMLVEGWSGGRTTGRELSEKLPTETGSMNGTVNQFYSKYMGLWIYNSIYIGKISYKF